MKRILFPLLLLLIWAQLFAQVNLDSLWSIWSDTNSPDTSRARALSKFYKIKFLYSNTDSALNYANLSLNFATQKGIEREIAQSHNNIGICYYFKGIAEKALPQFDTAIQMFSALGMKKELAGALINTGIVNNNTGNTEEALKYYYQGIDICKEIGDFSFRLNALNNIGVIHLDRSDYALAIESFKEVIGLSKEVGSNNAAIKGAMINMGYVLSKQGNHVQAIEQLHKGIRLLEETQDSQGRAFAYDFLGSSYSALGEEDNALKYYLKSYDVAKELDDKSSMATALSNIGGFYFEKGDFEIASEKFTQAVEIYKLFDNKNGLAKGYLRLGDLNLKLHKLNEATNFYNEALTISTTLNFKEDQANALIGLGKVLIKQKKYTMAIQRLKEANLIGENISNLAVIGSSALELSNVYGKTGQPVKALEMFKKHVAMKDSVQREENQRAVIQQEYRYVYEKKSLADSISQMENARFVEVTHKAELRKKNRTRNILIFSGFIILLIAGGLWSRIRFVRKANIQLAIAKNRAEQSERFKRQFLANMSHEIRTPMNAILGMTNLTLDTKLTTKQYDYQKAIKKSSENLLVIINDILDLSKLEAGKMELNRIPFRLKEQINLVHDTLRFKAEEKGLVLTTHVQKDIPEVIIGDPSRLMQVLINLTGNAIKFTEKGSVKVLVEKLPEKDSSLLFRVIDTGIGIRKDKFEILFNAFQQADASIARQYGGTGLGLTISKTFVELQGGEMSFKSESGKGSEFYFSIPFGTASGQQISELKQEFNIDTGILTGIKILLAEDNEYNRIVVNDTLENLIPNVSIDHAVNGKEAIQLLEKSDYDLILMDAHMPEMDGLEATKFIRNNMEGKKKDIPIVALTASVLMTDINKCINAGMNDSVPKPFKRKELLAVLIKYYNYKGNDLVEIKSNPTTNQDKIAEPEASSISNLKFLNDFCDGDQKRAKKYIEMYLKSTPQNIEKINGALKGNDHALVKTVVHSMKPHFNFMGMQATRLKADQIEELIESDKNETKTLSDLIHSMIEDCKVSLQEISKQD